MNPTLNNLNSDLLHAGWQYIEKNSLEQFSPQDWQIL